MRNKVAQISKEQHITLKELSQKTGITETSLVLLWYNEQPNPKLQTLEKIADALHITVLELFDEQQ